MDKIANGCKITFKPDYHDDPKEVFMVSQWDGRRGWAESENGGGWYFNASQVKVLDADVSNA